MLPDQPDQTAEPTQPADADLDPRFDQARRELLAPAPVQTTSLIFIALLCIFVVTRFEGLKSLPGIALLVVVLLFHESGHWLGMRIFGYRDVRMFFIPLFGAATSGRPRGAAAWKDALVSLMGPVPGIVLGTALFVAYQRRPVPWLLDAARLLLYLNLFNLLPLGGLDGGRFLQRIIFSRHRVLEVAFQAITSLALGALALWGSMWVLAAFVAFGLLGLPLRWRELSAASALRRQYPSIPSDPSLLDDEQTQALFRAAHGILRTQPRADARVLARSMESILNATRGAPGVLASLGLGATYVVAVGLGLAVVAILVSHDGKPDWQPLVTERFRVELPSKHPIEDSDEQSTPAGVETVHRWGVTVRGNERFRVVVADLPAGVEPEARLRTAREELLETTVGKVEKEETVIVDGARWTQVEVVSSSRHVRCRFLVGDGRLYEVSASAPGWSELQERFFDSFHLAGAGKN